MDKLIEKIDSYNIFNYFVPGAIIVEFLRAFLGFGEIDDLLSRLVLYYFGGLVVSRVGSIIFDPVTKLIRLIKHSDYAAYVRACDYDRKIELFVEIANMYRTLYVGAAICLIVAFVFDKSPGFPLTSSQSWLLLLASTLLFFVSYRKQSNYINSRVTIRSQADIPPPKP